MSLADVVSKFGESARAKFANPAAQGEPEDQLRNPLENLVADVAELVGLRREDVVLNGESLLSDLKTRPDYAVTVRSAQVGFIEVKAPGKGAEPRRYKGHDKEQWEKLRSLPNLLYTDGDEFALFRSGEPAGETVRLEGGIQTVGKALRAPDRLLALIEDFLRWEPTPPRTVKNRLFNSTMKTVALLVLAFALAFSYVVTALNKEQEEPTHIGDNPANPRASFQSE